MASDLLVGFLFGAGFGAWIYAKMMRYNGGNTKNSLIGAAVAGLLIMFVAATLLGKFVNR